MKKLIFYCFLCISLGTYAQQKYEREYRIPASEVPQKALDFIESFDVTKKVKWYQEQGLNNTSVEAKFKLLGSKYSIEFSDDGELQDIERKIPLKELPESIKQAIALDLKERYDAYAIEKIQVQYTGEPEFLLMWRGFHNFPEYSMATAVVGIEYGYEIIIRTRTKNKVQLFEFQFDKTGQKITQKEIITRDTDILKF